MSKYTAKQIAESDDLFDKQIHKVRKFYLSRNPDKMMMLEERKAVIKERNKDLSPEYDKEYSGLWFLRVNCFLWMMNMLERLN